MEDYYDEPAPRGRGISGAVETILLAGALALIVAPAVRNITRRWRLKHPVAQAETAIDKSLKDSFPASDPPASRYFDIPVNRR